MELAPAVIGQFGTDIPATGFGLDVEAVTGCLTQTEHTRPQTLVWYELGQLGTARQRLELEKPGSAMLSTSDTPEEAEQEAKRLLGDEEQQLYDLLCSHGELSLDQLSFYLKKPVNEVGNLAIVMEMKGVVFSAMGKIFIAKD